MIGRTAGERELSVPTSTLITAAETRCARGREQDVAVLSKEFKDALSRIEPGVDATHAADAHAEVREVLGGDKDLTDWGLHTLLIGSYKREVSIRRVKDVDVFCELPELPDGQDPQGLLDKMANVLALEYGDRVYKNDRSVKVEFPDFDMHVDVVPARPSCDAWEIPDKDGGWELTHPVRFGELTTERNTDHDRNYVPVVKLVRQTRRALLAEAKPGGLFVEVAAYHAFLEIPAAGEDNTPASTAEYYTIALEKMSPLIRDHADGGNPLTNPALPDKELVVRATSAEFEAIASAWEKAALTARAALASDDEQESAEGFRSLLGENSDGEDVFTVPAKSESSAATAAGHRSLPSGKSPTFG